MPVYTVHAPLIDGAANPAADRIVFVRDGFYIWAAIAGVLWFAFQRLWLVLLGYGLFILTVAGGLWLLSIGSDARLMVLLLIALLTGFEAASLKRWTLSRGKWRQLDLVVAENLDAAERRFFDRWVKGRTASSVTATIDRGSPPPVRPQMDEDIMGLFPQSGAAH